MPPTRGLAGLACVLGSLAACGGSPPPPAAAPAPAAPPTAVARPHAAPPADVGAVPAPDSLTYVVRVKSGDAAMDRARALLGNTVPIPQGLTLGAMAATVMGDDLAAVVDFSKPIDAVVLGKTLDDTRTAAVSMAVPSFEDAQKNLAEDFKLTPHDDGSVSIEGGGDAHSKFPCELRPSAGPTNYRLVCGSSRHALKAAGPYLTRTLAREEPASDAQVDIHFGSAVHAALTKDPPKNSGERMAQKMLVSFSDDLESISMAGTVDSDALLLAFGANFRGTASPMTPAILAHTRSTEGLPDSFWQLPRDADAAFATRGAKLSELEPLRSLIFSSLDESLVSGGYTTEDAAAVMKVISGLFLTGGPVAIARGFDAAAASKALAGKSAARDVKAGVLHGWTIVGLDEPTTHWIDGAHQMLVEQKVKAKNPPTAEAKADHQEQKTDGSLSEEPLAGAKLPAGSAHFVWTSYPMVNGKVDRKKGPESVTHFFVAPRGAAGTWIVMDENKAQGLDRLQRALHPAAGSTMGDRKDLQELRGKSGAGGFTTLRTFDALDVSDKEE
ncbi:MAG TPA: hypothetical protein VGI39_16175, partial [Polyangiaceae bacterium]